jgi:hypothetical protein
MMQSNYLWDGYDLILRWGFDSRLPIHMLRFGKLAPVDSAIDVLSR